MARTARSNAASRSPCSILDSAVTVKSRRVGSTDSAGGYDAGRHLARTGVDHVVIVTAGSNYRFGRARVSGCRAALAEFAPQATIDEVAGSWHAEDAYRAVLPALHGIRHRVGVFCMSDDMATGVYVAAKELGLKIPELA